MELPLNGLWSVPGLPGDVHGALMERDGQWILRLHDFFARDAPLREGHWEQIFGTAEDGTPLTLADCFVVRGSSAPAGSRRANDAEIFAGMIAYGAHVGRRERRLAGFDVVFEGLNAWYGHAGLSQRVTTRGVRFDYRNLPDIRCPAGDRTVTFSNRARMRPVTDWSSGIDFDVDIVAHYRKRGLMALEEIPELIRPLRCMLSMCCRANVAVAKVAAQVKEKRSGPWDLGACLVHYRPAFPGGPVPRDPRAFDRKCLGDLPAAVAAWHAGFPRLEHGVHSRLAHLGEASPDMYQRVADQVAFLESYLRGDESMRYLPEGDYRALLDDLDGFLERRVAIDELRKVLQGRARISNAYSLRTMLNRFADRHRAFLNRFLSNKKIKKCVYYAVTIRNGIAHAKLSPELRGRLDRVMAADLFMDLLATLIMLECMGIAGRLDDMAGHPYFQDVNEKLESLDI